jgi:hypothetical protein
VRNGVHAPSPVPNPETELLPDSEPMGLEPATARVLPLHGA